MGQGLGLAAISEARASACVSTYSRMFVTLPFRTVMAKTQLSSNVLFVALILPVAKPTTTTRSPCAMNSGGSGYEVSTVSLAFCSTSANPARPRCVPAERPVLARNDPLNIFGRQRQQTLLIAAAECRKKILHNLDILFDAHRNLSFSLTSSVSDLIGRFGTIRLEPNHTVVDRLLLLLEQILEDEPTPSLAACVHQRATLVELSQLDGCEPKFFGQIRHGSDSVLVIARQKDDPVAALDDRVGSQCGRNQVVKTFHQLSAGERLRNECGGRKTVQLLRWDWKRVHRVDDRLAFPTRQGLRNLGMVPERNRQDDCVSLECIPQRLGDDRGSNCPSLRCQRLGGPATRNGHVDVFTGEGVGEGLTYLSESYNCIAHNVSPILVDIDSQPSTARDIKFRCVATFRRVPR